MTDNTANASGETVFQWLIPEAGLPPDDVFEEEIRKQVEVAIEEADATFMVDIRWTDRSGR